MSRRARFAAAAAALALAVTGCADTDDASPLMVQAAASLQAPFEQLGAQFEGAHPGIEVEFAFAGSTTLVEQIRQGAPADVLATADTATMEALVEAGLHGSEPVPFATNTLMIAVPAGNPAGVTDLASLARDGLALVLCAPEVPCGAAATRVQDAAGIELSPVSEEQSVTDVLNKVTAGEADAGLVYRSDVRRAGDAVEGIELPDAVGARNVYPIATVHGSPRPELAQAFVDLVTGPEGRQVLADHGFTAP